MTYRLGRRTIRHRRQRSIETLESRVLLAGDLVGQWRADDLNASLDDQAVVSSWTDAVNGAEGTATGAPILVKGVAGGRSAVRFETSDGVDGIKVVASGSALMDADDFSVVATFVTSSTDLQGGRDAWLNNSGLIDANNLNFGRDWGLTINSEGSVSAGMGTGFGSSANVYSNTIGLNDGQIHVAALTRSGGTLTLYVDGIPAGSTSDGIAGAMSPLDVFFGRTSAGSKGFDGDLAEVRFYDGELTAGEVQAVYGEINSYYDNGLPQPVADEYSFNEDATFLEAIVTIGNGVLSNDVDPEGDALTAVLIEPTQHGTLSFNADGSFFYDSDQDFHGVDTFSYAARDFRDSAPVVVTINVVPVYDPAVAVADRYKILSGTSLNVTAGEGLLANDANPDLAEITVVLDQDVGHGSLTLADDGTFTYDPQGFAGIETFRYRINDGTQLSNTVDVTLVVNSPPVANDISFIVDEDTALITSSEMGVTQNDVDAESDTLIVTLVSEPQFGTLSLSDDGSFTYSANTNYFGNDSFTYRLSDGEDESSVATARITIVPVNDPPSPADDVYFGLADELLSVNAVLGVLANDADVESGELSVELSSGPDQGSVELASDGSFTYQPPAGFTGVATFAYSASDGQDRSSPATVQIAINSLEQQQQIVINEVHIDPDVKTEIVEFIELHNQADVPIDVSGWTIRDAVDFAFPVGSSVDAGGYLVVAMDPESFQTKFGKLASGPWQGQLSNSGETIGLWTAGGNQIDEVDYQIGFPWPTVGEEPGPSIQLIHPTFENDLGGSWRSALPTPGEQNSVFAENSAPQMRQVSHSPQQPTADQAVTITARVSDSAGVQSVKLDYQLVDAGDYISLTDDRYQTNWTSVEMRDDGQNGDATAEDGIYSVLLPAELQTHRRLVRYRLTSTDTLGASITAPYEDDIQPNFAYFVYNGVPDWTGSARPGVEPEVTYDSELLNSIPVYQLITTHTSHVDSQYISDSERRSGYAGGDYLWEGTMVYDGVVYDHIHYRARGGVWRYAMGKNMWKFDFNRGHRFQAKDNYGNQYDTQWDKLNFSALIQQGDYRHRGEQGLFESVGFKLFDLAGTESPNTNYVHFRIIESQNENGDDQYSGDFQGLYLTIEQPDGRFLDEHGLPDGNLYKIEGNNPESVTNQGPYQVDDRSDAREFIREFRGAARPEVQWWRDNLDLERYYGYQAISQAIHHYDTAFGKNFFYYNNPDTGLWQIHPWDLDLTWADNMYGNENHEFNLKVAKNRDFNEYLNQANLDLNNRLNREYQNASREILDLLYNQEQTGMLIDEMAAFVYQPGEVSFVDADRAMWDYNPINARSSRYTNNAKNATSWKYYQQADTKDYPGMIQILKDYVDKRNDWITSRILTNEENVPLTPTAIYQGADGFPVSDLTFQSSAFASPIGAEFAAIEWRIAEITDPSDPNFDPYDRTEPRKYEIESLWESGELDTFADSVSIPGHLVEPGKTYRVRVRMMDNDQHWSHWSDPVQFVTSAAVSTELAESLRISEISYNPSAPTAAELAAGHDSNEAFEFIELVNIGTQSIELTAAALDRLDTEIGEQGVDFKFADSQITVLTPGQRVLVVEDVEAFQARYGNALPVAGQWSGGLSNNMEQVTLSAFGTVIQQFTYNDAWYPSTDGEGATLEVVDVNHQDLNRWSLKAGWAASAVAGGTPGAGHGERLPGDSNADGIFSSSDLVTVFQAGEYEDGAPGNSTFEEGDWNGDGDFDSRDIVFVFQLGIYVAGAERRSIVASDAAGAWIDDEPSVSQESERADRSPHVMDMNRRPIALEHETAIDRVFDQTADEVDDESKEESIIGDDDPLYLDF